ncbi:MAG: CxxxxCH/CxxCH domain-containing protein [Deltaproteobacteria bacterium]|nr:MAG: CxxxxCH/CxxCH domain-containing protein [Deltaproteobacteria bacterium]
MGGSWVTTPPAAEPHGNSAKAAPGASSGFAYCQACHGTGTNFAGGSSGVSCYPCHGGNAPHPSQWRTGDTYVHTVADPGNASVCALCHLAGANSPIAPPSPAAPAGTPPGCFNSTLCHSDLAAPHALGSTWTAPNLAFHGLSAKQDLSFCQTCHGTPGTILFEGGTAPTKCSTCHTAAKAHPNTWFDAPVVTFPGYVPSHRNAGMISTTCTICHKVDGPGTGPNPAAPGCFSASFTNADGVAASCHANGPVAHASPFLAHTGVRAGTFNDPFPAGCATCHAVMGTSPISSAPLCTVCHTAGSPLTLTNCTSCHAQIPDGSVYPNIAGAHLTAHALPGITDVCNVCHNGLGTNTLNHYNRANGRPGESGRVPPGDVAFFATYNAKSGAASFNSSALTCSNVSCHGGQTTPNWRTGTIDVNTNAGCLRCHAFGSGQFNSFNSGEHDEHIDEGVQCRECHNMDRATPGAQNHFAFLGTTTMEGPASDTFQDSTGNVVYNTTANRCTGRCHGEDHESERWFGGD